MSLIEIDTAETFDRSRPPTFQEALDHAFEEAKNRHGTLVFTLHKVVLIGTNPVTDYKISLIPGD
jgi:hypothetical protein